MPAGGTWTVQNKKRPGAYINFIAVPAPVGEMGNRGTVAIALPMTWGPASELIELYGEDLLTGASLEKVGCTAFDAEESLPYRLALAGCNKALLYRSDVGGTKATKIIAADSLTAVAKHAGATGNKLSVAILEDTPETDMYTVKIFFDGLLKETFVVEELDDFSDIESVWVDFVVPDDPTSSDIPTTAGMTLATGTNGTVSETYTEFFSLIENRTWQCVALNSTNAAAMTALEAYIALLRDSRGRKVQCVSYDSSADTEAVITVNQGFKTAIDNVTTDLFPLWVASITAGANVNESNTLRVVPDATEIVNPVAENEIEEQLGLGKFLLSYRQDGAVVVEKDINSLHTFTPDKGYAFSKNRVIRCLDGIGNDTALIFNRNYAGKVDNDGAGRSLFKVELIALYDQYQTVGAIQNFGGSDDITVLPGEQIDGVVVDSEVQPVDSMEKLYMVVNVNG